jgi:hypothetical protein
VSLRDGPDGEPVTSRFIFTRVRTLKQRTNGAPSSPTWCISSITSRTSASERMHLKSRASG